MKKKSLVVWILLSILSITACESVPYRPRTLWINSIHKGKVIADNEEKGSWNRVIITLDSGNIYKTYVEEWLWNKISVGDSIVNK